MCQLFLKCNKRCIIVWVESSLLFFKIIINIITEEYFNSGTVALLLQDHLAKLHRPHSHKIRITTSMSRWLLILSAVSVM